MRCYDAKSDLKKIKLRFITKKIRSFGIGNRCRNSD